MSTILKALDRLEREKQAEQATRSLREEISTQPQVGEPEAPRSFRVPQGAWFALALIAVAGVTWFLASLSSTREPPARSEPVATPAIVEPSESPAAKPPPAARRAQSTGPQRPSDADGILALERPVGSETTLRPAPPVAAPISEVAMTRQPPAVSVSAPSPASPEPQQAAAPAPRVPASPPVGSVASVAPTPRTPAKQTASAAPRSVSSEALPAAPAKVLESDAAQNARMRVSRTVWHPNLERRLAFVSLGDSARSLRVREGDAVGTFVVQRIEPSGVIFIRDGVEVRRGIGER